MPIELADAEGGGAFGELVEPGGRRSDSVCGGGGALSLAGLVVSGVTGADGTLDEKKRLTPKESGFGPLSPAAARGCTRHSDRAFMPRAFKDLPSGISDTAMVAPSSTTNIEEQSTISTPKSAAHDAYYLKIYVHFG
eukprot:scaffold153552_cov32-Prasinocladus_malaysianus.AAC.6